MRATAYHRRVHGSMRDLKVTRTRARRVDESPWAVALNATAASDGISVTLLAFAVVDDVIQVSGVVRVVGRPNVLLSNIPTLDLASLDGPPLARVRAHGLPSGRAVWVSWSYERPGVVHGAYEARIDQIDLAYRAGGIVKEVVAGPWLFAFDISDAARATAAGSGWSEAMEEAR